METYFETCFVKYIFIFVNTGSMSELNKKS